MLTPIAAQIPQRRSRRSPLFRLKQTNLETGSCCQRRALVEDFQRQTCGCDRCCNLPIGRGTDCSREIRSWEGRVGWNTDQFDIEAKAEADAGLIPAEEMQLMVEQSQEYGRGGATGHVLSEGVTRCLSYWAV